MKTNQIIGLALIGIAIYCLWKNRQTEEYNKFCCFNKYPELENDVLII